MGKEMVALVLAGGKGTRLEGLTKKTSKPAVNFGGKYRIIDFVLSNCANSGVRQVGILTQYESVELTNYCSSGHHWGFDGSNCQFSILSPRQKEDGNHWYEGTADAVFQNLDYLESIDPEYVMILSSDHIYKMNYDKVLHFAIKEDADLVITCLEVDEKDVSRFGILTLDENYRLKTFIEKPKESTSKMASMGIYCFKYKTMKDVLNKLSKEIGTLDFGKHVIPYLLNKNKRVFGYPFYGYWRDVGTIESLWRANMDLIDDDEALDLYNHFSGFKIYTEDTKSLPQYIGSNASIKNSMVNQGSIIYGKVTHSVIFDGVEIGEGTIVENSVIMPGVKIGNNAVIKNCIISPRLKIKDDRIVNDENKIVLINN